MNQTFTIIFLILVWVISFLEPSGWAMAIHLPEKISWAIALLAGACLLISRNRKLQVPGPLVALLIVTFIIIPVIMADSWQGAEYLVAFLTVYLAAQGTITPKVIAVSGIIIAALGLVVLRIYVFGNILSGWNDNAISMVGLFSFVYFSMFLISKKGTAAFWIWNIVTVLYLWLLFKTECRSGMLFSVVAVVCIVYSGTVKKMLHGPKVRLLLLNLPLILALVVIFLASSSHFDALDRWSLESNGKGIFDGRDVLWDNALKLLAQTDYLGTGIFKFNYHNSGIAALSVFGVLGYICWVKYFSCNIKRLQRYLSDDLVYVSLLAFLIIYLQQSVDLGFISPTPNLIPYAILGIGLARIRMLQVPTRIYESKRHNTRI